MVEQLGENPVAITDTTFRDAHQSLLATRLRTEDMVPIASDMDSVGFHSMEVWGGATFDVATRFLAEDPWERLRTLKKLISSTPLMMLLRGQALVGYRPYADDVVHAFVQRAADVGIDIFRVFDGLNDERNLKTAAEAVLKTGRHLQIAICYSVTEEARLGGSIYNLDYFLQKARLFQDMGANSICLKDMGGLMAPYDAYELVTELKKLLRVPLQLHTHYTSGMASMTCLKAIDAGIDVVDACLAPLALRTSQPAVEPLVAALAGSQRDSGLHLASLLKMGEHLESILPKYRKHMQSPKVAVIDTNVLSHQIPGGMSSNLISQLREAGALDRLDEVLDEIPRTRRELGYPPLVTPMSQMVGSQSVSNVLMGRYKMVSDQVKDYVRGHYGRPPAAIDSKIVEMIGGEPQREPALDGGPGAALEPELEAAKQAVKELSTDIEDVLSYALYPTTGMKFLRIKYGLDPIPDDMKPESPEQPQHEQGGEPEAPLPTVQAPPKSPRTRTFNVFVRGEYIQVEVDPVQTPHQPYASHVPTTAPPVAAASEPTPQQGQRPAPMALSPGEGAIEAPMPGIVLRYLVEVGQPVQEGQAVVVLEAMKMENSLPSPITGTVKNLSAAVGLAVAKDDLLAIIAS